MRWPFRRGTKRLSLASGLELVSLPDLGMGISGARWSLRSDSGLFHQHDGYFVANGVHAAAGGGLAFQGRLVRSGFDRGFAGWADKDGEQVGRNRHGWLPELE